MQRHQEPNDEDASSAAEHKTYNIQNSAQTCKLFISGVQSQTSEDDIVNIIREYGNPMSIYKTRNNSDKLIAFVEFASQREADSVIINLDRKPPLHWSVSHATSLEVNNNPNNVVGPIYAHFYQNVKLTTPPFNVPATVNVSSVTSPSDFHLQFRRYFKELQELMAAIQASAIHAMPLPATPAESSPCLAIFSEDNKWYRAKVVKLFDDGIEVNYVDLGCTKKLENKRENLRLLEDKFSKVPGFAVRVKLAVVPPDGTNVWSHTIKDKFEKLVEGNDLSMYQVREEDGIMCVGLRDYEGDDIGQMLICSDDAS